MRPSTRSRSRSAWPQWRAYSSIMWTSTERSAGLLPSGSVPLTPSAMPIAECRVAGSSATGRNTQNSASPDGPTTSATAATSPPRSRRYSITLASRRQQRRAWHHNHDATAERPVTVLSEWNYAGTGPLTDRPVHDQRRNFLYIYQGPASGRCRGQVEQRHAYRGAQSLLGSRIELIESAGQPHVLVSPSAVNGDVLQRPSRQE
jgi:hypothetical protein